MICADARYDTSTRTTTIAMTTGVITPKSFALIDMFPRFFIKPTPLYIFTSAKNKT